jgi:hypothetical protein
VIAVNVGAEHGVEGTVLVYVAWTDRPGLVAGHGWHYRWSRRSRLVARVDAEQGVQAIDAAAGKGNNCLSWHWLPMIG